MFNLSHLNLIKDLQAKIHICISGLVSDAPMALVDFPNIRNVGDSAIWLGEIAYLTKIHAKQPTYVSAMWDLSDKRLDIKMPEGPIFIHGGGNFGDIWVAHQDFRERIIKRWPNRPIIQFPQSIHYDSQARSDESARVIAMHKNFTLLVRDEESKQYALNHFDCQVLLCPDMAFCIGPIESPSPSLAVLAMLREDREKVSSQDLWAYTGIPVEDWIVEPSLPISTAKLLGVLANLSTFDRSRIRLGKFNAAANQRFGRGVRQIGRAQVLVTDRLHVHIVSLLLGRPHAVLDNSYGKIARFMNTFSGGTNLSYQATSVSDAVDWARAQTEDSSPNTRGTRAIVANGHL